MGVVGQVSEFDAEPSALDANFGTQLVNAALDGAGGHDGNTTITQVAAAGANPYAATGQESAPSRRPPIPTRSCRPTSPPRAPLGLLIPQFTRLGLQGSTLLPANVPS